MEVFNLNSMVICLYNMKKKNSELILIYNMESRIINTKFNIISVLYTFKTIFKDYNCINW